MSFPQGFPTSGTPMLTPQGTLTPPWLRFFAAIWNRTGASTGTGSFAAIDGSSSQVFNVADAQSATEAPPLSQVQGLDAAVLSEAQAFATNQVRALAGQPTAALPIGTSPFSYSAPGSGELAIGGTGVQSVAINRGGVSIPIARHYGVVPLRAGDDLIVQYIGVPSFTWLPD